jgi:hypothetical protein
MRSAIRIVLAVSVVSLLIGSSVFVIWTVAQRQEALPNGLVTPENVSISSPLGTSGNITIGNQVYQFEQETVFGPHWSNFSFKEVGFFFVVWCYLGGTSGARLCGHLTEADGTTYFFSFWEPGDPPTIDPLPWQTQVSPDTREAIQFEGHSGGLVRLLVAD